MTDPERWAGLLESERALLRQGLVERERLLRQRAYSPYTLQWWEWKPTAPLYTTIVKLCSDAP
jgi:hypothetical protein